MSSFFGNGAYNGGELCILLVVKRIDQYDLLFADKCNINILLT